MVSGQNRFDTYAFRNLAEGLYDIDTRWYARGVTIDYAPGVKNLFNNDTEPLLTPGFWILPLYRELLDSACRNRPSAPSERGRGYTAW